MAGGLLWISTALSTINLTTSPRLSTLKLDIGGRPPPFAPLPLKERFESDIRLIDQRVARIEREFSGVTNFTMLLRYPVVEAGGLGFHLYPLLTSPSALKPVDHLPVSFVNPDNVGRHWVVWLCGLLSIYLFIGSSIPKNFAAPTFVADPLLLLDENDKSRWTRSLTNGVRASAMSDNRGFNDPLALPSFPIT